MRAGWEVKRLSEICIVDWGNTNLTKSAYVEGGEFLAVSAAGCDGRICHKEHNRFTPVLSAIGAQCGRMFLPEEDFTAIKNTITMTPLSGVCTGKFLYQLLNHVTLPKRGAAQPFISKGDIQAFKVAIPVSLEEQHRIVTILDEAFASIATARATAEQNLQNARALFDSHLQSVFSQRGKGWVEKPLCEVASILNGYAFKSTDFSSDGATKSIKITNVGVREFVKTGDSGLPASFSEQFASVAAPAGSLVIALTRTIIADGLKVAIVPPAYDRALVNQRVAALLPKPEEVSASYLFSYLSTSIVLNYVKERVNTLMQPNLSINDLRAMPIPLPPASERQSIIDRLNTLEDETHCLEALYQRKVEALDELKQSLLHQAFSGLL